MNVLVEFVTVTKTITKTENNAADLKGGKNPRKTHFKSNNRHPQIFIYFFILDLKTVSVSHSIVIINIYIYICRATCKIQYTLQTCRQRYQCWHRTRTSKFQCCPLLSHGTPSQFVKCQHRNPFPS